MVQNNVKHKVKLPSGVKKSSKSHKKSQKSQQKAPKKGQSLKIAPKNSQKAQQINVQREITKIINEENESLLKQSCSSSRL